ncbi:molybdenum cofactor biosynthesis protein A [Enhygromyxa salina]|uniref:Molybdenum cofactor biosynthesis protein A n=1 Tax=Enhygromyxa salina TaxID=215803 RepID=A0A2S9XK94_9BACT|nr:radical SAM protein [Enhygromyxa salina]PRP93309.1 molybdenum cofactor biosynthesis protein A [Enhygromyxa salina]
MNEREAAGFVPELRRRKSEAFDLEATSTAGEAIELELWGQPRSIYANANFSVYSAQVCNARCRFCVEELRPASRGRALERQRSVEPDDERYFAALAASLEALRPLGPTISITGGEPSKDPRLPRILALAQRYPSKRRSLTTNASGLLDVREGRRIIDHIVDAGVEHLNISRAHPDHEHNARLMVFREGLELEQLREVVATAARGGCRVRLSCVLVERAVDSLDKIRAYLDFAGSIGVDNVIFRQLMHVDRSSVAENFVVAFSDRRRTQLEPLLDQISEDPEFEFQRQIVGYYYYVEVWRRRGIDVVFEEADLGQLERTKQTMPGLIHELIFHPNARLASTWQPWDGVLGPPPSEALA